VHLYCTAGCRAIAAEIATAQRLRRELGSSAPVDLFVERANALADAWQASQDSRYEIRCKALDAGWTAEQFTALARGRRTHRAPATT
jgi:hypothetical protein